VCGQRHVPGALPPGRIPDTECTGGWVGPRAGLVGCAENLASHPESIPDHQARSERPYTSRIFLLAYCTSLYLSGSVECNELHGAESFLGR